MTSVPQWCKQVDAALRALSQRVPLLAAATPSNARQERVRLQEVAGQGREAAPAWRYASLDMSRVRRQLD
ncbi:MAG TPA: hypothetical protein VNO21_21630, partial [Polyangiaceae bacterium]|nr:hypothetical protein [Polyangiaceae bacterium]